MVTKKSAKDSKLMELYAEIPEVAGCKNGCGQCCGPVPLTPVEAVSLGLDENTAVTPTNSLTNSCVFYGGQDEGCTVYDLRPFMCRLFGASKGLPCPLGAAATKPLSEKRSRVLTDRYKKMVKNQIDITQYL